MDRSKFRPRSWGVARVLGFLPGLALAGVIAGCSDRTHTADPAATTSANPTPEQIINANPSSPSVPPAEGTTPATEGGSASKDTGQETSPAETPGAEPKNDAPKVIEKPAEPTPSDKSAEPK